MGKKYFDTKEGTLESSVLNVWAEAAKKSESMDKVNPKALKKDFDDRKDKDIDNDGDVDDSDEYLHNRRKTVAKAVKKEEVELDEAADWKSLPDDSWVLVQGRSVIKSFKKNPGNRAFTSSKDQQLMTVAKAKKNMLEEVELDEAKFSPKEIKMAIGIASDPRYKGGDMTGAADAIDKIKDGLSDHPQVRAVLRRQNESYEIGTDEYRDHTLNVTPGQDNPEWIAARDFKVASMKEALAKVWGLDEKVLDKSEESDTIAPVNGKKSMTGGKVADVAVDPEMKDEK